MPAAVIDHCYWTHSAASPPFPRLAGNLEVDVAIIGAGLVGTVAARLLKDRGQRVALIEAGRVGRGVTGRSTAKVTAQHRLFLQRIKRGHRQETARAYAQANQSGV